MLKLLLARSAMILFAMNVGLTNFVVPSLGFVHSLPSFRLSATATNYEKEHVKNVGAIVSTHKKLKHSPYVVEGARDAIFSFDFESAAEIPETFLGQEIQRYSPMDLFHELCLESRKYDHNKLLIGEMKKHILYRNSLAESIASVLASKLATKEIDEDHLFETLHATLTENPQIVSDSIQDLLWIRDIDPAATSFIQPFLYYKGFHAVIVQRIGHRLWVTGDEEMRMIALMLQSRASEKFSVDAHPGAKLSHAIMIDHASGVVIGETASIGHHCYILHGVTLGATGKAGVFDRHPKVGNRVKIGAGAMILGNIPVSDDVVVGAGAIVTIPVGQGETVVGINRVLDANQRKTANDALQDMNTWMFTI
mmetsp:Transcript_33024/g.104423  ORF Transcript_33024/g.104423 Transcript_33024/m.104423 type:complete len:366 (-) Transcript_33024:276-1373(-)